MVLKKDDGIGTGKWINYVKKVIKDLLFLHKYCDIFFMGFSDFFGQRENLGGIGTGPDFQKAPGGKKWGPIFCFAFLLRQVP